MLSIQSKFHEENFILTIHEKVQVGNDQEKAHSERNSHTNNRSGKKNKLTIRYEY